MEAEKSECYTDYHWCPWHDWEKLREVDKEARHGTKKASHAESVPSWKCKNYPKGLGHLRSWEMT